MPFDGSKKNEFGYVTTSSNKSIRIWSITYDWDYLIINKPLPKQTVTNLVLHTISVICNLSFTFFNWNFYKMILKYVTFLQHTLVFFAKITLIVKISQSVPQIDNIFVERIESWIDCSKHLCNWRVFYVVLLFVIITWFPFQQEKVD